MRVEELLKQTASQLKNSDSPKRDAEWLIMELLRLDRAGLISQSKTEVNPQVELVLKGWVQRREDGEPIAYIVGHMDFYKYRFSVNPNVLIPRPETEHIVEETLARLPLSGEIADLGCGSGCIGLSVLMERPLARLWACDISALALATTEQNAVALGLQNRVKYSHSNVTDTEWENHFEAIVSNPPYIAAGDERLELNVKKFEPASALFAKDEGLEFYKQWIPWSYKALKKRGFIVFEFGQGQAAEIKAIAEGCGFQRVEIKKDLSDIERVVIAVKE